uniref:Uncharacterized protein MANES_15G110800 n=1 Tax=Rhizophora mucronata TaxID=61149 RepID=A0A2P2KIN4_RHIMU
MANNSDSATTTATRTRRRRRKGIIIEEEIEGEHVESIDYFFDRIGKGIPISSNSPVFQLQSPPSRPLAVSQHHFLIFLAHSSGFYAARTKDVMDAAEEMKAKGSASSIQDLCVVDVPIGKLHILALSSDSSTLAATIASDIYFFAVASLLNKELQPSSSCSLNKPIAVKDFQWRKRLDSSYLVLSNDQKLYHGALGGPLKDVMDNVDAVEWSVKGKFIAVAKENDLIILSSKFEERLCITLPSKSWVGESNDNCSIRVDSIRWVRFDSIVVGCFQQTADDKEEDYFLWIIKSIDGKITDASSSVVVLSFYDLFSGLVSDIVPYGGGPYLFLSYLEQCGLAITANRKNTDQHIVLLGWSADGETSKIAAIDIERDTWLPRIELQDSGDDNLILGLCIDELSLYGKVKVEVGVEEQKELSPHCVLICVTLEGKLIMFRVASVAGTTAASEIDSTIHDVEEDSSEDITAGCGQSILSSGFRNQKSEQVGPGVQPDDMSKKESSIDEDNGQRNVPVTKLHQDIGSQQSLLFGQQVTKSVHPSLRGSVQEGASHWIRSSTKTESQKFAGLGLGPGSSLGQAPTDVSGQLSRKDSQRGVELAEQLERKNELAVSEGVPSQSLSIGKFQPLDGSEARSQILPLVTIQGTRSDTAGVSATNVTSSFDGKPVHLRQTTSISSSINFSVGSVQVGGQQASVVPGKIESLPSMHGSQLSSQENLSFGRSPKEDYKSLSLSNLEPNLSRQFGNIKEMARELGVLLECIEETGGFRDACTVLQRSSVEALEEGLENLSEKCIMWKNMMNERLGEIKHLLDSTVQVLARKMYMDGIVKQASDGQYRELWNRQKLSSELELKRRHILKLNQDLTDQLIELERHFNTLEYQKFGESGVDHIGQRSFQNRYGPSRHMQSLHCLPNTMSSQLAVAEQLSECLSKQMVLLSVESPVKQKNVKKELFETIGIPYDASFSSPDATKGIDTSPVKKLFLSSGFSTAKDQSRKQHSSALKSSDTETARRRRDSLDQSWARFEPTKTTIERVLLQESQKKGVNKSSSLMDKQHAEPCLANGSALTQPEDTASQPILYASRNEGNAPNMFPKHAVEKRSSLLKHANEPPQPSQATGLKSPMLQSNNVRLPSALTLQELPMAGHNEAKFIQQSETNKEQFSVSMVPSDETLRKASEFAHSHAKGTLFRSSVENVRHGPRAKTGFSIPGDETTDRPFSHPAAAPAISTTPQLVSPIHTATSKSQPGERTSPAPAFPMSFSVSSSSPIISSLRNSPSSFIPSSLAPTSGSVMSVGTSLSSSKTTIDGKQTGISASLASVSLSPVFHSDSSTPQTSNMQLPLFTEPSISDSVHTETRTFEGKTSPLNLVPALLSEAYKSEVQPNTDKTPPTVNTTVSLTSVSLNPALTLQSPKTDLQPSRDNSTSQKHTSAITTPPPLQPEALAISLKLESSVLSGAKTENLGELTSGSQPSFNNMVTSTSNVALAAQCQQPSTVLAPFGPALTSDGTISGKNGSLDVSITEEDEMEEETSESGRTNELSLQNLGGFGIGSTPITATPRQNPFGGTFSSIGTGQTSSPFTMTVPSGELFRPASFSLQSPQFSQPSLQTNLGSLSGGFSTGTVAQAPSQGGFGQPAQIGPGQQALGSVLGAFGQSRQLGTGLAGSGFASAGSFGSGFVNTSSAGGFSNAATGGGFASVASARKGFAGMASGGGGFAGMASGGGGGGGGGGVKSQSHVSIETVRA